MMTPDPRLRCGIRSGASPKKRRKNSSPKNSSNGVRRPASTGPAARTVLMLIDRGLDRLGDRLGEGARGRRHLHRAGWGSLDWRGLRAAGGRAPQLGGPATPSTRRGRCPDVSAGTSAPTNGLPLAAAWRRSPELSRQRLAGQRRAQASRRRASRLASARRPRDTSTAFLAVRSPARGRALRSRMARTSSSIVRAGGLAVVTRSAPASAVPCRNRRRPLAVGGQARSAPTSRTS